MIASLFALTAILEPVNESLALCVGSGLEITCNSTKAAVLRWIITTNSGSPSDPLTDLEVYSNSTNLEDVKMIGDFVVRLESSNSLVSTVTLDEVDSKHNGTVLTCTTLTPQNFVEFTRTTILIVKGILLVK